MTKKYSDLKAIVGHKNYYQSEKSGIIYYKDPLLGKFSTKESTILRAKTAVNIRRQTALEGKNLTQAKRSVMKITNPMIKDIWQEFVKEKATTKSKGTIITYNTSWKLLNEFFGDMHVNDLNEKHLIEFKNWYIKNHYQRLVERTVIHIKGFIKFCHENRIIREVPRTKMLDELVEFVDVKSNRKPHERTYSPAEVELFLKNSRVCTEFEYINIRTFLAILLAARCGMRKNEILKLKKSYLDFKDNWINILSTKNNTWRKFPLSEEVIAAVREQEKHVADSEWLFPMPSDLTRPISSQILDKCWVKVKKMSFITGVAKFHDFRKTCVTDLIEKGFSSDQISKLTDHSVEEIHDTYYKLTNKFKDEFLEKSKTNTIKQGEVAMKKSST